MNPSHEAANYIPKNPPLDIWRHFLTCEDERTAKCKICSKILKTTGGCTIGLYSHLYGVHRNMLHNNVENPAEPSIKMNRGPKKSAQSFKLTRNNKNPAEPAVKMNRQLKNVTETTTAIFLTQSIPSVTETGKSAKKRKLNDYYRPADTIETVVARMVALDGVSFRLFAESKDLRHLFKCSGYNLPETTNAISEMIFKNVDHVKEDIRKCIADMSKTGHKFTLSLDEWTSKRNKRYINITLHCKALNVSKVLGPVNVTDTTSSIAAFTSIKDYLKTYNVSIQEDIVSLTTDGSSDMRKIGIHFAGHHQWCLAQGVQIAVINTMYRMCERESLETMDIQDPELSTDTSSENDDDSFINHGEFEVGKLHVKAELHSIHKQVIEKLRQVVRLIMDSRLNAAALQAYVKKELNENTELKLDNQKSWTSLVEMVSLFLKLKNCVLTLLTDLGSGIVFTEEELRCLNEIHFNLDLVRGVVLSLCKDDATLYSADTTLRSTVTQLEALNTDLSLKFASNLRKRIKDRRLTIAGVLHYLHDIKSFKAFPDDDTTFVKPTNDEITELIVSLLKQMKFKCVTGETKKNLAPSTSKKLNTETTVLIFDQEMELIIKNKSDQFIATTNFDLQGLVLAERKIYEKKGERGVCLNKAYEHLTTVKPTNVPPQRIFAVCGCVSTRITSSHPDKMLEALIFLKTYYEEQKHILRKQENVDA